MIKEMLFNYVFNLPNNSASGGDTLIVDTVSVVPSFTPLLLAFVFFVVFLGGILRQKDKSVGGADYPMWATIASLATLMTSLILSVISGLIQLEWLVIVVVITIFCGVWLFLDKRGSEV